MKNMKQKKAPKSTPKPATRKRVDDASSLSMQVEALTSGQAKLKANLADLHGSVHLLHGRLASMGHSGLGVIDTGKRTESRSGANNWRPGDRCWISLGDGLSPQEPFEAVVHAVFRSGVEVMENDTPTFAFFTHCFRTQEAAETDLRWLLFTYGDKMSKPPFGPPSETPSAPQPTLQVVRGDS